MVGVWVSSTVAYGPASNADIRTFRSNAWQIRVRDGGLLHETVARLLVVPLALNHAFEGIRQYGRAVRERDGVSRIVQFARLTSDFGHRVRADDFYLHQLHLDSRRHLAARHFDFKQVLPMQQYLIEAARAGDYDLLRSKSLFAARCVELDLPTVPVLAEFVSGAVLPPEPLMPDADLFSKPSDLMLGVGGALWRHSHGGYLSGDGEILTAAELCARLAAQSRTIPELGGSGAILLQPRRSNHAAILGRLTQGGLATVRLVTSTTPSGDVCMLPPVIRMPVGDSIADNFIQGGLAAPVDIVSGRICGPAVRRDKSSAVWTLHAHPDTGVAFDGFQLPFWPEVLALGRRAHRAFPSLHFIGWDIPILAHGPVLLEGNAWWDVDLTVLPHRISLSDTPFVTLYNHHYGNVARLTCD